MHTIAATILIGKADGTRRTLAMRYAGSHQRGYRCFIGPIALSPDRIQETTRASFEGRRLFDALAEYRNSIEPQGWRLLHAAARCDCWPKPDALDACVQQFRIGVEETHKVNALERAGFDEVSTLSEQRASFEAWMRSLTPIYAPRTARKAGHEHDEAIVEFGPLALLAGEYLSSDEPDYRPALRSSKHMKRNRRPFPQ